MTESPHDEILLTAAYFEAARTHLHNLADELRRRPEVTDVLVHFAPREYRSCLVIESYVEAEMTDGRALLWWLELNVGPEYTVEAYIAITDEHGQRTIEAISGTTSATLPEALRTFADTAHSLARRADILTAHSSPVPVNA